MWELNKFSLGKVYQVSAPALNYKYLSKRIQEHFHANELNKRNFPL